MTLIMLMRHWVIYQKQQMDIYIPGAIETTDQTNLVN